jgi:hypothetical protein
MWKRFGGLAILLLMIAGFSGCSSNDDDEAFLRVLHGSPDAPAVDVRVDGTIVLSDVSYLESSDYLSVDAGDRLIEVSAAGTDVTVIEAEANLAEEGFYTVIAANLLASIEPLVLVDDATPPASGNIRVRIVHGAPSAPEVDVYVTEPDADLLTATPDLIDVSFKAVSDYLEAPAGTYQIRVTVADTLTVAIDSGPITLEDGVIITVVAVDADGGGSPFGAVILDDGSLL